MTIMDNDEKNEDDLFHEAQTAYPAALPEDGWYLLTVEPVPSRHTHARPRS